MQVLEPQPPAAKPDAAVIAHYKLVAPLIGRYFAGMPLVWAAYADGEQQWHARYFGHVTRVTAAYINALASIGAQEFYSWFAVQGDDKRARYLVFAAAAPKEDFSAYGYEMYRRERGPRNAHN